MTVRSSAMGIAVAALSILVPAISHAGSATLARIAETNIIRLAYRESSVPFSYLVGPGRPGGFAVDLADAVADAVRTRLNRPNLQIQRQAVTSQNRIPLVQNGTIDLECGSTTNNSARAQQVGFSVNFFYAGIRMLVRTNSGIKSWSDLRNRTVSMTTGTTSVAVVRRYSEENQMNINQVTTRDFADALLLVESGRADSFVIDDVVLYGLRANSRNPEALAVVGDPLSVEAYACMVRREDPEFKALVDEVITGLMRSGEFERLYARWFLKPIPPRNRPLDAPMSDRLRQNIASPSDQPAE